MHRWFILILALAACPVRAGDWRIVSYNTNTAAFDPPLPSSGSSLTVGSTTNGVSLQNVTNISAIGGGYIMSNGPGDIAYSPTAAYTNGGVAYYQRVGDFFYWSSVLGPQNPSPTMTNQVTFNALAPTNTAQSWVVPAGASNIFVKLWGAAGGGGGGNPVVAGGNGGFESCYHVVAPGETLTVWVGSGGQTNSGGSCPGGVPGGGAGFSATYAAGGGGGYTAILRDTNVLSIAAGGGGSGIAWGPVGRAGGAGGASTGGTSVGTGGGTGGSQTSGGITNGIYLAGGSSTNAAAETSRGGGGGGYYGGGAATAGSGGGGGCCYPPTALGGYPMRGNNTSDENYPGSIGGGLSNANGQNGYALIFY